MSSEKNRQSALSLLSRLRNGELRAEDLSASVRRVCVIRLMHEGCTPQEMAEILKVSRQTIWRDEQANRKECAQLADNLDIKEIAGRHMDWANHLRAKALKNEDYALAWKIERELQEDLQSYGVLYSAPQKHEVKCDTFADFVMLAQQKLKASSKKMRTVCKRKKI